MRASARPRSLPLLPRSSPRRPRPPKATSSSSASPAWTARAPASCAPDAERQARRDALASSAPSSSSRGRRRRRRARRAARRRRRRLRRAGPRDAPSRDAAQRLATGRSHVGPGTRDADIDAPSAWDASVGAGVTVARRRHRRSRPTTRTSSARSRPTRRDRRQRRRRRRQRLRRRRRGWDFVSDDNVRRRTATATARTSPARSPPSANNSKGVVGVAPAAKVLPLRALDNTGTRLHERHRRRVRLRRRPRRADRQRLARRRLRDASWRPRSPRTRTRSTSSPPATTPTTTTGRRRELPVRAAAKPTSSASAPPTTDDRSRDFSNYGATTVDLFAPGRRASSRPATRSPTPTRYLERHVDGRAARRRRRRARARRAAPAPPPASSSGRCCPRSTPSPGLAGKSVTGGRLNAERRRRRDHAAAARADARADGHAGPPSRRSRRRPPEARRPAGRARVARTPARRPRRSPTPVPTPTAAARLTDVTVGGSLRHQASKLRVPFSLTAGRDGALHASRAKAQEGARRPGPSRATPAPTPCTITRRLPTGQDAQARAPTSSRVGTQRDRDELRGSIRVR